VLIAATSLLLLNRSSVHDLKVLRFLCLMIATSRVTLSLRLSGAHIALPLVSLISFS